ncbi:MAG TPA: GTP 3',8-cyclase MoaA [Conexivisphaerales archaeon]|nr:GTP 3',8-cyclase MoaA [Conexivisphaerales archaeon]
MVLVDRYGRPVSAVRIAVTPECNFDCVFCHNEGFQGKARTLMTPVEIGRVTKVLLDFGVRKVKLTGGEPMMRPDIIDIVAEIGALLPDDLGMTTNGTKVENLAEALKDAGMKRLNISLHSLKEDRFKWITSSVRLKETLAAISRAVECGLTPVKLNTVLLKGYNEDELWDIIAYAESLGGGDRVIVQLIELVPVDLGFYRTYHYDLGIVEEELKEKASSVYVRELQRRPQYTLPNGVRVEIVRPIHNVDFCMADNRIRVTHDGRFKPCLLRDDGSIDFLKYMRKGCSDQDLAAKFMMTVWAREPYYKKPKVKPAERITVA